MRGPSVLPRRFPFFDSLRVKRRPTWLFTQQTRGIPPLKYRVDGKAPSVDAFKAGDQLKRKPPEVAVEKNRCPSKSEIQLIHLA